MLDDLELSGITDTDARQVIARLLNVVEELSADLAAVKAENQRLREQVATLQQAAQARILIDKDTRVVTQGITGKTGMFHTQTSRAYAN